MKETANVFKEGRKFSYFYGLLYKIHSIKLLPDSDFMTNLMLSLLSLVNLLRRT